MAPPEWLPPLNSHEKFFTSVHIKEYKSSYPYRYRDRTFKVALQTRVDFYSENNANLERPFPGFCVENEATVDMKSTESLEESLLVNLLKDEFAPFSLEGCFFTDEDLNNSEKLLSGGRDDLLQLIVNFVYSVDSKRENRDLTNLIVAIQICKHVFVPEQEFSSWVSWYEEKKRVNPDFEVEYEKAISKPRDESQILQEELRLIRRLLAGSLESVIVKSRNFCCICLEELCYGEDAIKLPCGHLFDEECILRWLIENQNCPLCRRHLMIS